MRLLVPFAHIWLRIATCTRVYERLQHAEL